LDASKGTKEIKPMWTLACSFLV